MFLHILVIIGSLGLLVVGAEGLVRGSTSLAQRLGISSLVIGLTVVAFGTNSPELAVSLRAAASGNAVVGLGNVIGANISNLLLILGVAALIRPLHVRTDLLRREVPVLVGVTLLLVAMLWDRTLSRAEGVGLVAGSLGYLAFILVGARRNHPPAFEVPTPRRPYSTGVALAWLAGGLAALLLGAWHLLGSAVVIAESLGMSRVAIGLTVVAIGTSLPELATTVVAAFHGDDDVALGNVVGSNILNILLILGLTAVIAPIEIERLRVLDTGVLVASAVLLVPLLRSGGVVSRLEGGFLVLAYVAYLVSLIP